MLTHFRFFVYGLVKDTISVAGGKVSEDGIVESFENDDEALSAFDNGVVVCNFNFSFFVLVSLWSSLAAFLHSDFFV